MSTIFITYNFLRLINDLKQADLFSTPPSCCEDALLVGSAAFISILDISQIYPLSYLSFP